VRFAGRWGFGVIENYLLVDGKTADFRLRWSVESALRRITRIITDRRSANAEGLIRSNPYKKSQKRVR